MSIKQNFKNNSFPFINITNLVDIALTLVVILLMIAPYIEQGIEVKLPASSPAKINVEKSIIITIAPGEVYYLGDKKMKLRELYQILKQKKEENPNLAVVVKGDENIFYKDLVKVLDIVKKCNIVMVGLATRVE